MRRARFESVIGSVSGLSKCPSTHLLISAALFVGNEHIVKQRGWRLVIRIKSLPSAVVCCWCMN